MRKKIFFYSLILLLSVSIYSMYKLVNLDFNRPYIEIGVGKIVMYPVKEGVLSLGIIISTIIYCITKLLDNSKN